MYLFKKKQKDGMKSHNYDQVLNSDEDDNQTDFTTGNFQAYEEETALLINETEEFEYETTLLTEEDKFGHQNQTNYFTGENKDEEEYEGQTALLSEEKSPYLHPEFNLKSGNYNENNAKVLEETDNVESGTTLLSCKNFPVPQGMYLHDNVPKAYLIKIVKAEKIYINKVKFIVGSGDDADYVIHNGAISKRHIFIIYNNQYYIMDNQSSNRTFLDGNMLESLKPTELYHGALIQLADELLQFICE